MNMGKERHGNVELMYMPLMEETKNMDTETRMMAGQHSMMGLYIGG